MPGSLLTRLFGAGSRSAQPINSQWVADHLGRFQEFFEATFDSQDRLTHFGLGTTQCIQIDPDSREAERKYDQYRETYKDGCAESFDAWSDNDQPLRVDFWSWAQWRVLEICQFYFVAKGDAYQLREAERQNDPNLYEDYTSARLRVDQATERARKRIKGY